MAATAAHPYLPAGMALPGYRPPVMALTSMLGLFFGAVAVIIGSVLFWAAGKKYLSGTDRFLMCWFACCGFIHLFVEGAVVANSKFYQDTQGNFLNEIWREYSKADSRYATRDAFVIQMEAVTAWAWGPLSFLIAYAIVACKPWRFYLMTIVSMGQFYGCWLYFATCFHNGLEHHTRPEPLYFWFYFVFMNIIWMFIPGWIILYSGRVLTQAVAGTYESTKKSN